MANTSFYQRISAISPNIEMINRRLYYLLKPIIDKLIKNKQKRNKKSDIEFFDFNNILNKLIKRGLKSGDILVMHASFNELKGCNLSPIEIVNKILEYLGPEGTLAMPAITIYPKPLIDGDGKIHDVFEYDVKSTKIWTGALAKAMITDPRSVRSLHPLNSMVAIGSKAEAMMENNEKDLYPCGINSSWNYCCLQNALVLGLGTDLPHSLTMIHVAEDTKGEKWVVPEWYQDRKFRVKNGEHVFELSVKERKYKWGKFHYAERNLAKDLISNNIMKTGSCGNILIETLRSIELIEFLENNNIKGYPYFWV